MVLGGGIPSQHSLGACRQQCASPTCLGKNRERKAENEEPPPPASHRAATLNASSLKINLKVTSSEMNYDPLYFWVKQGSTPSEALEQDAM